MGTGQDEKWREECEEAGDCGGSPKVGGTVACAVVGGGRLRSVIQPQGGTGSQRQRQSSGIEFGNQDWILPNMRKRRVEVTARSRQIVGSQATGFLQVDTEIAAPLELRTPMGTA